jgi:hypothetical protein
MGITRRSASPVPGEGLLAALRLVFPERDYSPLCVSCSRRGITRRSASRVPGEGLLAALRLVFPERGPGTNCKSHYSLCSQWLFISVRSSLKQAWIGLSRNKNPHVLHAGFYNLCGGRGIRTPGTLRYNGFQDRRIRPLCHSSGREISKNLECGVE